MRKLSVKILIFSLLTIMSIQTYRLQNIEYRFPAVLCENNSEINFRVLDKVTLDKDKTNVEVPPGNWVYFFSKPLEPGSLYKVEIMRVNDQGYSKTFLVNLHSKFDLHELRSKNIQYCITKTADNNLVSIGHYYEINLI